jgi:hypothetical protein
MSWWLPALKAVLPHVGTILDAAKPVFTKKPPAAAAPAGQDPLTQQQIAELQAAVSQNAANVRALAAEVQKLRRFALYALGALAIAVVALAVTIALLFYSGTARAQEAALPQVTPGDRWTFAVWYATPSTATNRERRVTSVGSVIEATENGEPLRLTRELGVLDSPLQSETNPRRLSFPLAVGKAWRYESEWLLKPKASRGTMETQVTVVAYEKVSVPAGTFEAFRLEAKSRVGGTSPAGSVYDASITATYWYAPQARAVVRLRQHNPYTGPYNLDLVAFELQ